jgi:glutathione synthase/RimK-type ligase-like ATP-grasp enzyme
MRTILILTADDDVHADEVVPRLRARGADVVRFDPSRFPSAAALTATYGDGPPAAWLTVDGRRLRLEELHAAWYRRPGEPKAPDEIRAPELRQYVERECYQVFHELCSALDVPWLPGPLHLWRRADNKHLQLRLAAELGFPIPSTLVSSDPDALLAFHRRHDGAIIDKQPSVMLARTRGEEVMRYSQMVSTRDIAYARRLRYSPMLFQRYVDKAVEVRVTVVGTRVFAAEIHSQSTAHTRHDWRRYDHTHTPHRVHALPEAETRRCLALVERLGLCYGAIDLILTPAGQYVFLEINPNGQWLWIEHRTELPISDAVADLLVA